MKVDFEVTVDEVIASFRLLAKYSHLARNSQRRMLFYLAIIAIGIEGFISHDTWLTYVTETAILFVIVVTIHRCLFHLYIGRIYRRLADEKIGSMGSNRVSVSIDSIGITIITGTTSEVLAWSGIQRIDRCDESLVFWRSSNNGIALPIKHLESGPGLDAFLNELRSRCKVVFV